MAAAAFGEGDTVVAAQTAERSPDSGDRLNELAVWSLATGRRVRRTDERILFCDVYRRSIAGVLPERRAVGRRNPDAPGARPQQSTGVPSGIRQAAFSANGNLLAIATASRSRYGTSNASCECTCVGFTKASRRMAPESVAFAPDGRVVAVGDEHGQVKLLDALTGEDLGEIAESTARDEVTALAFAPDGRTLISGTEASRA